MGGVSEWESRHYGKQWLQLTEACASHDIDISEEFSASLKQAVLCALCLVALDEAIAATKKSAEELVIHVLDFQEMYCMADIQPRDNDVIRGAVLSGQGKRAAEIRHKKSSSKLKAFAIFEFQNNDGWKSTRQASKTIFPKVQAYAVEVGIPPLSPDRGPQTVYEWLLKSLKEK